MNAPDLALALPILKSANDALMARNRTLVDIVGTLLKLEPTADEVRRAIEVWRREIGVGS